MASTDPASFVGYCGLYCNAAKIQALIVEEKHRREGIGEELAQRFIEKAKQNGCRVVKSRINRGNKKACLFHEKLGFWQAETYEYILEL